MTVNPNNRLNPEALKSQRVVFAIAFVGGSLAILISRELGFGAAVSSTLAALVMLSYLVFGLRQSLLLRASTLGDNLYYLGFLYTLVSLSYTLYKYSDQADVTFIVQNFGIALATTIVGLLGRVALSQERDEPELYEHAVRMSLTDAAAETIGETNKIRSDLSTLRTSIMQSINEGVTAALETMSGSAELSARTLRERLEIVFGEFQERLGTASRQLSNEFERRHSELEVQISGLITRLQSDLDRSSLIQSSLLDESGKLVESLAGSNRLLKEMGSLDTQMLSSVSESMLSLQNELSSLSAAIRASVLSVGEAGESAKGLQTGLNEIGASFSRGLSPQLDSIGGDLAKVSRAVSELGTVVDSLTQQLMRQTAELERLSSLSNNGYAEILTSMQKSAQQVLATNNDFQDRLRELSVKIVESLNPDARSDAA